jgi:hypothetical protein
MLRTYILVQPTADEPTILAYLETLISNGCTVTPAPELLRWLWLDVAWSPYAVHVLPAFLEANQEYFAWPTRQFAVVR